MIIPNSAKHTFWLAFCLCLFACLFIIFIIAPLTGVSKHFGRANDGYIQLARSLGAGDGYVFEKDGPPVFHRPPLYPALLVPITFLPDPLQQPALIFLQSIMVGLLAALIFRISQFFFDIFTARAAVLIFLLNPWVYWNAKNPMTVILQGLLFTVFALLVGREFLIAIGRYKIPSEKNKLWFRYLAIGIAAAAATLTHGAMLAVGGVFIFILFVAGLLRRNVLTIKISIISIAIMAALIAPWTLRNWVVFDRFIPVVGGSGLAYFNGNVHWRGTSENPRQRGESYIDASLRAAGIDGTEKTHTHWKGLKDIELEDKVNKKMAENLRSHPVIFLKKVLLNAVEYYFPNLTYPFLAVKSFSLQKLATTFFNLILWALATIFLWQCTKDKTLLFPAGLLLAAILLYAVWFLPFATFIGHSLYTFATIPFLSILSAGGLLHLGRRFVPQKIG